MAEQKELKINIAPDKAQGVFANLALIAHTPTEFVLDFAQMMPGMPQPVPRFFPPEYNEPADPDCLICRRNPCNRQFPEAQHHCNGYRPR